jgi:hypothetical protein
MSAVLGRKIVAAWASDACGMPIFRVHQTEYPEIQAEGQTPADACDRLVELLVQARDFACEAWRRRPLGLALVDARSFTDSAWNEPQRSPPLSNLTATRSPAHFSNDEILNMGSARERLRGDPLDGDRVTLDGTEASITIKEGPGLQVWPGRYWLPADSRVEPGRKYGPICDV